MIVSQFALFFFKIKLIKMILDRLGDNPIYVAFDLDCLDSTVAPVKQILKLW